MASVGAGLLLDTLKALEEGTVTPQKQGDSPTGYAGMLKKEMGVIDWSRDAASIERLIRGLNPWPSAYGKLDGKTLKIWSADVLEQEGGLAPGTVTGVTRESILVQTGRGMLAIRELQLEGKKRMDAGAFLRGYSIKEGTSLCY